MSKSLAPVVFSGLVSSRAESLDASALPRCLISAVRGIGGTLDGRCGFR